MKSNFAFMLYIAAVVAGLDHSMPVSASRDVEPYFNQDCEWVLYIVNRMFYKIKMKWNWFGHDGQMHVWMSKRGVWLLYWL